MLLETALHNVITDINVDVAYAYSRIR